MNGWAAGPSAWAVGKRKNPPKIAPPNQAIAAPTWTTRRTISRVLHHSVTAEAAGAVRAALPWRAPMAPVQIAQAA